VSSGPHTHELTDDAAAAIRSGDDLWRAKLARKKHFISHHAALEIRCQLEEALERYPTSGDDHLLIVGDPGMGKTQLIDWFRKDHTLQPSQVERSLERPVLSIGLISGSPRGFLGGILEDLGVHYSSSSASDVLYPLVLRLFKRLRVRVLLIDELHHAVIGNRDDRAKLFAAIKQLGNDLGITIVACGTAQALLALQYDPQLERRFQPVALQRWRNDEDGWAFLNSIEMTLPLPEPSNLSDEAMAPWILDQAEGLTGEIDRLVRLAAVRAIKAGRPCIDLQFLRSTPWTRPSQRRESASRALAVGRPVPARL
jgi:hypothetical protein